MEDIITLEKDNLDWWESEDFNYDELDDPDVFAPKQETNTVISGQEHDIVQPEITEEGEDPFFRDDRDNFYPETVDVNPDVLRQIDERLRSLSMKDYEQSQFDVHGLSKPIEETPEMIQESLDKLDLEIQKLKSTSQGKHYRMAEAQSAEFCQDRTFRIRFLRSTCFDVKAAAKRAVLYFTAKLDLWGKDKLCKKISLGDFTKDDLETLQNGHLQILPVRDQGGRALCFFNYNNIKMKEKENQLRTWWYLSSVASEDEETQKNGWVVIVYKVGPERGVKPDRSITRRVMRAAQCMPIRLVSIQSCFSPGRGSPFIFLIKYILENTNLAGRATGYYNLRVRMHQGSHSECIGTLMTFGIPRYAFPLTANGDMSSEYHKYWLKGRRQKEKAEEEKDQCDSSNATNVIIMPSRLDVILGRGKRSQQHVGNLRLNFRLEQSLELYNQLDNVGKLVIIMEMISFVKKDGGRFLKLSPDGVHWEVVSDDLVRQKLGHDYRTIRKRIARLSNTNNKVVETKASKRARPDRGD